MFDAISVRNACIRWIRDFFAANGSECNAVVGISGGKDSSVVAALCVEALGRARVIGVLMPNGVQDDFDAAQLLVDFLGIRHYVVNIRDAVDGLECQLPFSLSRQAGINLPARIRMATLYAVSQSHDGRGADRKAADRRPLGPYGRGEPGVHLRGARRIPPGRAHRRPRQEAPYRRAAHGQPVQAAAHAGLRSAHRGTRI